MHPPRLVRSSRKIVGAFTLRPPGFRAAAFSVRHVSAPEPCGKKPGDEKRRDLFGFLARRQALSFIETIRERCVVESHLASRRDSSSIRARIAIFVSFPHHVVN